MPQHTPYGIPPKLPGNIVYLVVFTILLVTHVGLAFRYKQRWFGVCFLLGIALEILGYAARIYSHFYPYGVSAYTCNQFGTTLGPILIVAGYYFLLAHFVIIYGVKYSTFKRPISYSYIFIGCDIISLLVQGSGGGVASAESAAGSDSDTGSDIMIAGLVFQVISMSVFLGLWFIFLYKIYISSDKECDPQILQNKRHTFDTSFKDHIFEPEFAGLRDRKSFKLLPIVVTIGVLSIYVRCCYRVAELSQGWSGYLITHEIYLFVLDSLFIFISCVILTFPFYPGLVFRGYNVYIPKSLRKKRKDSSESEMGIETESTRQVDMEKSS